MMICFLGKIGFFIVLLVFGGNVFGWIIDEKISFVFFDVFVDYGFDVIDMVDVYFCWVEGNQGGEFEIIIGCWLQVCFGMCDKVKIFIKVGFDFGFFGYKGFSKVWI